MLFPTMRRNLLFFFLLLLPLGARPDGMVIPTVAYPAQVAISDQQAALSFSNGSERLVIETRFTAAGTNFAWVVPLPNPPVIEQATTGFFPTLQYLCRPEIIHNVPKNYAGVLALLGLAILLLSVRPTGRIKPLDLLACLLVGAGAAAGGTEEPFNWFVTGLVTAILFYDVVLIRLTQKSPLVVFVVTFAGASCLCGLLLPAGMSLGSTPVSSTRDVTVLDRQIVGVFETTTLAAQDARALQSWLADNGYQVPANSEAVIAGYVRDHWVFVATKVLRNEAGPGTSTPRPLSFTFKTAKPVYPMRLTGLSGGPLHVDLFVLGDTGAAAPHFAVERSTRLELRHSALRAWFGPSAIITKLAGTLQPADMDEDVWISLPSAYHEYERHSYSRHGALITAGNRGAYVLALGVLVVSLLAWMSPSNRPKAPWLIGLVLVISAVTILTTYAFLPQIEVELVRGSFRGHTWNQEQMVKTVLNQSNWHTAAEVRTGLQAIIENSNNAVSYGFNTWDNILVGGKFREEDSPGNYLLRETNHQVKLYLIDASGEEQSDRDLELPKSD
jgi:hypothetical protein